MRIDYYKLLKVKEKSAWLKNVQSNRGLINIGFKDTFKETTHKLIHSFCG